MQEKLLQFLPWLCAILAIVQVYRVFWVLRDKESIAKEAIVSFGLIGLAYLEMWLL